MHVGTIEILVSVKKICKDPYKAFLLEIQSELSHSVDDQGLHFLV